MTPEESIEILEEVKELDDTMYAYNPAYMNALDMAIEVLKEVQLYKDNKLCLVPEDVYSRQCSELDAYKEIGTVEECREARGYSGSYYKDTILEAVDRGNGSLEFVYATPESREKTAKTNRTQYVTFKLKAGAENGDVFGVNWDNVKSVSGQTYDLRSEIKDRGFRWDGKNKRWVKK